MSRFLVAYDDTDQRLHVIDPANATGIPMPTAQVVASLPPAGSVFGELLLDESSKIAYIWDGNAWMSIMSDFMHSFATDADVLAATIPEGHIAISEASGNFFIKTASGYRQWGVREYTTRANLLADTPPAGSIGVSLDDHAFWMRTATDWLAISVVQMADIPAVLAWDAPDGTQVIEMVRGLSFSRIQGKWWPRGIWMSSEANIRSDNTMLEGQLAVATDTGRLLIRTATGWEGSPIRSFAAEADLLAETPADGVFAWAEDTGLAYMRSNGNWVRINSPTVTVAAAAPATPAAGDLFHNTDTEATSIWDGAKWSIINHPHIGDTAPANPYTGQLWFDTTHGSLIVYDGTDWKNPQFISSPTSFSSRPGDIWYDETKEVLNVSNGTKWIRLGDSEHVSILEISGGGQGIVAIPKAEHQVSISGSVVITGAAHLIELIGQKNGTWIDWGAGFSNTAAGHYVRQMNNNGSYTLWTPGGWDQAGAELGNVAWKDGGLVDVHIELLGYSGGATVRWNLSGRDNSGNMRTSEGVVRLSAEIFPITTVGLKILGTTSDARCTVRSK